LCVCVCSRLYYSNPVAADSYRIALYHTRMLMTSLKTHSCMCAHWAAAAAATTTGLEERNNSQYTHCRRPCVSLSLPSFQWQCLLLLPTYFSIPCSTHTHTRKDKTQLVVVVVVVLFEQRPQSCSQTLL